MNQSKHTPGPWILRPDDPEKVRDSDSAHGIAVMSGGSRSIAEREANAHLIAAAPDLLHALDSLLTWMIEAEQEMNAPLGVGYRARVQKGVVIEKARAALQKSIGKD